MTAHNRSLGQTSNSVVGKGSTLKSTGINGKHVGFTQSKTVCDSTCNNSFVQAGGASSDWRNTNYSRGPVNYPNNGWFNGKKMFKQFSKNAYYIPNDKLAHAVAPKSTGIIKEHSPVGQSISGWANSYANY